MKGHKLILDLIKYSLINQSRSIFLLIEKCVQQYLETRNCFKVVNQEILYPRSKRSRIEFHDPLFKEQWHLNGSDGEYDVNTLGAWESGISGRGVTVCVIDDGLEWKHPDLINNYNPLGSYDLTANDLDPSPIKDGEKNEHGTRCAGEIAAVANDVCGVGVAHRANISGIRVLSDRMTDSMEAAAFIQGLTVNDVYSCSWGPNDDGKTVDGPHYLARKALLHGVTYGRKGYGALYVVASGNGGTNQDNCNFDGYANSIYTITIGAVNAEGKMPYYAEECSTLLAVAPSSGRSGKAIVTTDWRESNPSGCTQHHSGTSAAAPLAAGVIALALEMQPCLSWKDVQYLIVLTSRKIDKINKDWTMTGSGLHHSHQHGFGLIDASTMVSVAAVWESVPFSTSYRSEVLDVNEAIPSTPGHRLSFNHSINEELISGLALRTLEFVQVFVTLDHENRGSLKLVLSCPSGTKSVLASPRKNDDSSKGLHHWPFGTVRCWGEDPTGTYSLWVEHTHPKTLRGRLISIQFLLHGSPITAQEFQKRRKLVVRARNGEPIHVNRSRLCHTPELKFPFSDGLAHKTLKILLLTGCFVLVLAISNTLEFAICHGKDKRAFESRVRGELRSQALRNARNRSRSAEEDTMALVESVTVVAMANDSRFHGSVIASVSPSESCDADISDFSEVSNESYGLTSHHTDDTILPKDTTDFATDQTASEPDELKGFDPGLRLV